MKHFIFFTILSLTFSSVFSQEKIATYSMSHISSGQEYKVQANEPNSKGEFSYYIEIMSLEGSRNNVTLIVDGKKLNDFVESIQKAKDIFSEWDSIAVANSIVDLDKEMKLKSPNLSCAFLYGSSWHFDFNVNTDFIFKHLTNGNPALIVKTGKLQSSTNQFIDSNGGVLVFLNSDEIDNFIRILDRNLVFNHFSNKKNKESLFVD